MATSFLEIFYKTNRFLKRYIIIVSELRAPTTTIQTI